MCEREPAMAARRVTVAGHKKHHPSTRTCRQSTCCTRPMSTADDRQTDRQQEATGGDPRSRSLSLSPSQIPLRDPAQFAAAPLSPLSALQRQAVALSHTETLAVFAVSPAVLAVSPAELGSHCRKRRRARRVSSRRLPADRLLSAASNKAGSRPAPDR